MPQWGQELLADTALLHLKEMMAMVPSVRLEQG